MRTEITTAGDDTPTAVLLRECAAKTVDALVAELRRRPIVQPEWLSLQETAVYCGYSEQQFSDFVKRGIAPRSVLFSRNARRFKRTDVDAWCAAGGPSQFGKKEGESVMSSKKQAGSSRVSPSLIAALAYAARGWHIYPSFPGTKAKTN